MPDDPRELQIEALRAAPLDVLVLGGGINGAGILRDLALRVEEAGTPLRLGLVEQRQFASGMARRLADLMFVSTPWRYEQEWTRERLAPLARQMGGRLGWDGRRLQEEIDSVLCQAAVPG